MSRQQHPEKGPAMVDAAMPNITSFSTSPLDGRDLIVSFDRNVSSTDRAWLLSAINAYALRSPPQDAGETAARENLREAWAAMAMLRETVETLAPSGAVKASEHLGPTFMHEADALVAGIIALSAPPQDTAGLREALTTATVEYVASRGLSKIEAWVERSRGDEIHRMAMEARAVAALAAPEGTKP